MNLLSICNDVDILKTFRIIRIIIVAIKIIVPLVLLVSGALTFTKAVSSGKTNEAINAFKRKAIAAIIIFLVPTFIGLVSNISNVEYLSALSCIKNSTTENINKIALEQSMEYLAVAEKTLNRNDLYAAYISINKVEDTDKQKALDTKAKAIEKKILAKEEEERKKKETAGGGGTNAGWWWPVGSRETTEVNGKLFATGAPSATRITATFGGNDSVHRGLGGGHGAIDIGAERGSNVIATKSGTVISPAKGARIDYPDQAIKPDANGKYNCKGLIGNEVIIDHGNGIRARYAHLYKNTITVRAGDHVEQGQVIGKSGSSGCSSGPHLHFQLELNGSRVDPLKYVSASNPRP
jgi:murein DD-endopeptidase MepM/ murein hydrolase activator NlpD